MTIRPGEVEVALDNRTVVLRPSLKAARTLNKRYGNFNNLLQALAQQDFEAIVSTFIVGTGAEGQTAKDLEEAVYSTGTLKVAGDAIKFVGILSNGGKPLDDDDKRNEAADPNGE